jgi:hypothetical protein
MRFRLRDFVLTGSMLGGLVIFAASASVGCEQQASENVEQLAAPIIGGKLDTTHRGVVSLLKAVQGGYYPACSGTLITQNLVLTAHHCVAGLNSADGASVECSTTQFKQTERAANMIVSVEANVGTEGIDPFQVANVWVPTGSADVCGRDVALLLLSGSGVPAKVATPIEPALSQDLAANEVFAAIGYGLQDPLDETGKTAGHRMSVSDAQVYCDGSACGTDMVKDGEFIASSPVCSGDSGGPALDKDGRVSGVTSRGDDKCTVGIYSSVYAWRDFIIEKTFVAAASGHYDPPAWAGQPPPGFDPGAVSSGGTGGSSGGNAAGGSGGLAIAGNTASGSGGLAMSSAGSSNSPTIDPLGIACDGHCPGSYKCWAASGKPPGICVPECSASNLTCPTDFTCDTTLGACIKPTKGATKRGGGCSIAAPPGENTGAASWLGLLLLGGLTTLRAQRRARVRSR